MNQTVVHLRGSSIAGVAPGTRLNDIYEVDDHIASGGMGEIYRGHLIETGDPVAIKMIKPELVGNESVLALFRKEASALHHLHHDSIVRYYVFTVDRKINRPYLAMEFVEGSSLSDFLKGRPLRPDEVNFLRKRIASGLQVAHDKGIIHRDMSPDNIIMPEDDVRKAKIIDFGIARSTRLGHQTVIGDGFAGKYNYVSPEQLGLFGADVTNRSDIYSLGLVLAEALTGQPIDMSGSQADVIDKRRQVPDLSKIDPDIRPLLHWMLQPKPDDRPESMQVVADWTKPVAQPAAPATRKSAAPIMAVGALAVAAVAGGGGWLFLQGRQEPAPVTPIISTNVTSVTRSIAITPQARAARIRDYVRYYDGGQCLYLLPRTVSERSAKIEALTGSDPAIKAFEADFRNVNGFSAELSASRLKPQQCEVVPFLQRLDTGNLIEVETRLPNSRVGRTEPVRFELRGVGDRPVRTMLLYEDGRLANVSSSIRRDREQLSLDPSAFSKDKTYPQMVILLNIVTQSALPGLERLENSASDLPLGEKLDKIAREIESAGVAAVVTSNAIEAE